jgi:ribosome-associated protein
MKIPIKELNFTFSRSSGAGGQNVNKVNTKVSLTWDFKKSESISNAVKKRFEEKYKRYIVNNDQVKITSQRFRNQSRNIVDCTEKLQSMLEKVAVAPKKRIATKPTKNSIAKRIDRKKNKSKIKKNRQKIREY